MKPCRISRRIPLFAPIAMSGLDPTMTRNTTGGQASIALSAVFNVAPSRDGRKESELITYIHLDEWKDYRGFLWSDYAPFVSSDRGFWYNRVLNAKVTF